MKKIIITTGLLIVFGLTAITGYAFTTSPKEATLDLLRASDAIGELTEEEEMDKAKLDVVMHFQSDEMGVQDIQVNMEHLIDNTEEIFQADVASKIDGLTGNFGYYFDGDKLILEDGLLEFIEEFTREFDIGSESEREVISEIIVDYNYFYTDFDYLKEEFEESGLEDFGAEFEEAFEESDSTPLIEFFVESIPEKYFSQDNGEITVKIEGREFNDVMRSFFDKLIDEEERFQEAVAQALPIIEEAEIEEAVNNLTDELEAERQQDYENITAEFNQFIAVNEISFTFSAATGGQMEWKVDADILPVGADIVATGTSDGLNGGSSTFEIDALVQPPGEDGKIEAVISGETGEEKGLKYAEISGNLDVSPPPQYQSMLDFSIDLDIETKELEEVNVQIPELTEQNSVDLYSLSPGDYEPGEDERALEIFIDGTAIETDVDPFIEDGRTKVPMRFVAEELGADVEFNEPDEVVVRDADKTLLMWFGEKNMEVNGQEVELDVAPEPINGRTFVPLRFVSEQLGAVVDYDEAQHNIHITP